MPEERDQFTNGKVRKTAPNVFAASLGYASSQRLRKHNEESVDCSKTVAGLAQLKVRGLAKVRAVLVFALAAYDLVRLPELPDPTGEMCSAGKKEVEMIYAEDHPSSKISRFAPLSWVQWRTGNCELRRIKQPARTASRRRMARREADRT